MRVAAAPRGVTGARMPVGTGVALLADVPDGERRDGPPQLVKPEMPVHFLPQVEKVRSLFVRHEASLPPWAVRYRSIFGAPLEAEWLAGGWTSHLSVRTEGGAPTITSISSVARRASSIGTPTRLIPTSPIGIR
jgi:hypothetical protein